MNDAFTEVRARIREAHARLAGYASPAAIRRSAPVELVAACGFSRAMLSGVRGSRWIPLEFHSRDELDPMADDFRRYVSAGQEIALANLLAETTVVRRRTAMLVDRRLLSTRAFRPIVEASGSTAYVAAPLLVEGSAIGLVHADRVGQPRPVDDDDARHVRAFALGLSVVYQLAVLTRAVERAPHRLEQTASVLRELSAQPFQVPVAPSGLGPGAPDDGSVATTDPGSTGWESLTAREIEVLGHAASGATNRVIAQRLSVSEDTVKFHVRNLLRKLRASSRGAAVARYVHDGPGSVRTR